MNDFARAAELGSCLAKPYAAELFRLLASYRSLSASETADRLDLHVQTAQSFLETLAKLGIVDKVEATDKTRPYFRYSLKVQRVSIDLDFSSMGRWRAASDSLERVVRERRSAGARFVVPRGRTMVSSVVVWIGTGRDREERRLSLTQIQGAFLFRLPRPTEEPRQVAAIMADAGLDDSATHEILDLVDRLESIGVVEATPGPPGS